MKKSVVVAAVLLTLLPLSIVVGASNSDYDLSMSGGLRIKFNVTNKGNTTINATYNIVKLLDEEHMVLKGGFTIAPNCTFQRWHSFRGILLFKATLTVDNVSITRNGLVLGIFVILGREFRTP